MAHIYYFYGEANSPLHIPNLHDFTVHVKPTGRPFLPYAVCHISKGFVSEFLVNTVHYNSCLVLRVLLRLAQEKESLVSVMLLGILYRSVGVCTALLPTELARRASDQVASTVIML